ncbi:MAG: phage GP46 family protein, partial [Candidatus Methylumidiphilus sp.]
VSIFTERRALADDVLPAAGGDRRGWWGDAYADIDADRIGSRLWLLERSRDLPNVLLLAEQYLREAVQWLIDDGVVEQIDCKAERPRPGMMLYTVTVLEPKAPARQFQFSQFWRG